MVLLQLIEMRPLTSLSIRFIGYLVFAIYYAENQGFINEGKMVPAPAVS